MAASGIRMAATGNMKVNPGSQFRISRIMSLNLHFTSLPMAEQARSREWDEEREASVGGVIDAPCVWCTYTLHHMRVQRQSLEEPTQYFCDRLFEHLAKNPGKYDSPEKMAEAVQDPGVEPKDPIERYNMNQSFCRS